MKKEFIGIVDATPNLIAYWLCECHPFKGSYELVSLKKGGKSATNLLTLGYKYKSVHFKEVYATPQQYEKIVFTDFE